MQKDYTHISVVLDRSGSMASIKEDTIGGYNQFLSDQKAVPGKAALTLVRFDHEYDLVCDSIPIGEAKPLDSATFVPRGNTALLDAIGRTILDLGANLEKLSDDERPEKIIFVIVTDGQENASREFTLAKVNEMITHQQDKYAWQFVFLGANQDAIREAGRMGIAAASAMSYAADSKGVADSYQATSRRLADYRKGAVKRVAFDDEDREKQKRAGFK